MKSSVRNLDWDTPVKRVPLGNHWRILVCIMGFSVMTITFWHLSFPHTMWFLKLWCGFSTGSLLGIITGAFWQCREPARIRLTSGKFLLSGLLCFGTFTGVSLCVFAPQMRSEERVRREIRSVSPEALTSIYLDSHSVRWAITQEDLLRQFCEITEDAELFFSSHEMSAEELEISFHFRDKRIRNFHARVPSRHPQDLALQMQSGFALSEILLPGGWTWIESVME